MNIPRIICSADERGACAAFGLSLTAIRPEALLLASDDTTQLSQLWKNAHERNVRLIQVLARWPHKCSVELHIVTHPSLDGQKPGWNEIGIIFRVRAGDQADATELALSDSIQLNALLDSFLALGRVFEHRERGVPTLLLSIFPAIMPTSETAFGTHLPRTPIRCREIPDRLPNRNRGLWFQPSRVFRNFYPTRVPLGSSLRRIVEFSSRFLVALAYASLDPSTHDK